MTIIVLAVLLSVAQTTPPVPRQTADSPAYARQNSQTNAKNTQTPTTVAMPTIPPNQTVRDQSDSSKHGDENTDHPIIIGKLPTVTVSAPRRDWADWGYWVFSLLLVGVGGLQVYLLWRTLGAIKRQADKLDESVAIADKAAVAAKDGAKAALLNAKVVIKSERPWLIVEIKQDPRFPTLCTVVARNKGRTPAEMVDGLCGHEVHPVDFVPTEQMMGPFNAPVQSLTMKDDSFEIEMIDVYAEMQKINKAGLPVIVPFSYGRIRYWDTFTDRAAAVPYETQWCVNWTDAKKVWYRSANGYSKNT